MYNFRKTNVDKGFYDKERIVKFKIKTIKEYFQKYENNLPVEKEYKSLHIEYNREGNKTLFIRYSKDNIEFYRDEFIYNENNILIKKNEKHGNYESFLTYEYDKKNRLIEVIDLYFEDRKSENETPKKPRLKLILKEYDESDNLIKEEYCGGGTMTLIYTYDENNLIKVRIKIFEEFDDSDERTLLKIGKKNYFYDKKNNLIKTEKYNVEDTIIENGYYKIPDYEEISETKIFDYDDRNNLLLEISLHNIYKFKTYIRSYKAFSYNSKNNLLVKLEYDKENKLEYSEEYNYDKTGELVLKAIRLTDEEFRGGFSHFEAFYDYNNNLLERVNYNENGEVISKIRVGYNYFE